MVSKALSLNLNFSFFSQISLLFISSSYPIVLIKVGDPVPDPILQEKLLGYSWELNLGPLGWQSDMLTTIPNMDSLHIIRPGADQSSKAAFGKSDFAKTCFLLLKIRHGAHQSSKKQKCFPARFGTF